MGRTNREECAGSGIKETALTVPSALAGAVVIQAIKKAEKKPSRFTIKPFQNHCPLQGKIIPVDGAKTDHGNEPVIINACRLS